MIPAGLKALMGTVVLAAFVSLAWLPTVAIPLEPWTAVLVALLAGLTASRRIRFPALRAKITVSDPFVLCALGALGPAPAVLAGIGGVIGAGLGQPRRPLVHHLVFNLAAVIVSVAAASWTFVLVGGMPGAGLADLLLPLAAGTVAYFACNTLLVAAAIGLERHLGLFQAWRRSCGWTAVTYFTSLTIATALLLILAHLGPWGLALGVAPCWLLLAYVGVYKDRLREQRRRVAQVERLNRELESTVGELQSALAHVKRLQGLLPICMHCKKIRDDHDTWHRIESYIAQHSEARFTHSLCADCREEHYPPESMQPHDVL